MGEWNVKGAAESQRGEAKGGLWKAMALPDILQNGFDGVWDCPCLAEQQYRVPDECNGRL